MGSKGTGTYCHSMAGVGPARSMGMSLVTWLRERCPQCQRSLINSHFDTTFRLADETERLCFSVPGSLCEDCQQLYIDPELIDTLDVRAGRCVFAIESDLVLREPAWSRAE